MQTQNHIIEVYRKRPKKWILNLMIFVIVAILFIWSMSGIAWKTINPLGLKIANNIFSSLFNPNWSWLFSTNSAHVPYLMFETLVIAFIGTLIGAILAIPVGFLSARNIMGRKFSWIGNLLVILIRTFPTFVIALIILNLTIGAPAGVITIAITSVGMLAKLYAESIEEVNHGITESMDSTGATTLQKIRFGILPQLSSNFISHSLYRFDINVRNTVILGIVAAGGIGFQLNAAITNARYRDAAACLWGIIIVVVIVEFVSNSLRKRLIYGKK